MRFELLDKSKKKRIIKLLEEEYGIKNLSYLLIKSGNDEIRIYSGGLSIEEINKLGKNLRVELIGTSLGKLSGEDARISFDALNIPEIKSQITKNIVEIDEEQLKKWMRGNQLEISTNQDSRFIVIKNQDDFYGAAKNSRGNIPNYVPKERRVKN